MDYLAAHRAPADPLAESVSTVDLSDRPVVAFLYVIAGTLMELFGPIFWAVLIVGFLNAEIFLN